MPNHRRLRRILARHPDDADAWQRYNRTLARLRPRPLTTADVRRYLDAFHSDQGERERLRNIDPGPPSGVTFSFGASGTGILGEFRSLLRNLDRRWRGGFAPKRSRPRRVQRRIDARGGRLHYARGL
jgi:hypothetical protein